MKRVLAIAPYRFLPARSGGHRYIQGWYQALSQQTQLTVISTADNSLDENSPYRVLPLLSNSFFRYGDLTLRATIRDLIQRNQYDLLVWEHPYFAWLANLIKKDTGIPYLLRSHNIEFQRFRSLHKIWWPLLQQYEKWAFQQADFISFISKADKDFATTNWNIDASRCLDIPFGVENDRIPENRADAAQLIRERYAIPENEKILLFNGPLDYSPNREALEIIIKYIAPYLQDQLGAFKILICGGHAPKKWSHRKTLQNNPFIDAGFVENIKTYIMGADLLLNPILTGGGVKTKIIESISLGTPVLTTATGAKGIDSHATGNYMQVLNDGHWQNWPSTIVAMLQDTSLKKDPLTKFFETYNWSKIIEKTVATLAD